MDFSKLIKAFITVGIAIFLLGYLLYSKDIGGITGMMVMISGSSLIVGAIIFALTEWRNFYF